VGYGRQDGQVEDGVKALARIVRIRDRGEEVYGLLKNGQIEICAGTPFVGLRGTGNLLPAASARFLPPVVASKMVAVWRNSEPLIRASKGRATTDLCYVIKPPSSFIGDGEAIVLPAAAHKVIFEAELGLVVGRRCRYVEEEHAPSCVLGWTVVNEVTASDIVHREPSFAQHTRAKGFDTFGVFGPVVDTEFEAEKANIRAYQNGELRQDFNVRDLVRKPYRILAELSRDMTLEPGDIIACGSSLGVAPMLACDMITIEIPGLGRLTNPVVAESSRRA
jgi:2-keto-4-pentenoate hydratase/2-oxohepta-3-ene-1,7-dioic acid hydratase in catechol pathway